MQDVHRWALQEDGDLGNFPISRLVSSTRNYDLELCSSPRFPALLTMALRIREEAGVSIFHRLCEVNCAPRVYGRLPAGHLPLEENQPGQDLAPASLCPKGRVLICSASRVCSQGLSPVPVPLGKWQVFLRTPSAVDKGRISDQQTSNE